MIQNYPPDMPVLLADDDESDVLLMKRAFKEARLSNPLKVVSNGEEAISYLDAKGPYAEPATMALAWPVPAGFEDAPQGWMGRAPMVAGASAPQKAARGGPQFLEYRIRY